MENVKSIKNSLEKDSTKANEVRLKDNFYLMLLILLLSIAISCLFVYIVFFKDKSSNTATPQPIATVSPTPIMDEIIDWETYSDSTLGISFKYPSDSQIQFFRNPASGNLKGVAIRNSKAAFSVTYRENIDNLSLEELDQKTYEEDLKRGAGIETPKLYSADAKNVTFLENVSAFYEEEYFCEPTICERYVIPRDKRVYQVILSPTLGRIPGEAPKRTEIMDQILSTFKFLDDGQVSTDAVIVE